MGDRAATGEETGSRDPKPDSCDRKTRIPGRIESLEHGEYQGQAARGPAFLMRRSGKKSVARVFSAESGGKARFAYTKTSGIIVLGVGNGCFPRSEEQ